MAFYFASEKTKREINEDSYCQMELRINLEASISAMVVADGMGGLAGGKFYSETRWNYGIGASGYHDGRGVPRLLSPSAD